MAKHLRGADPQYDYHYGNNVASYQQGAAPFDQFMHGKLGTTPGAMIFGKITEWLAWRPMIGPAIAARTQFRTLYNVFPVRQNAGLAATTGLGGVIHGQVALQPLSDPYSSEPY